MYEIPPVPPEAVAERFNVLPEQTGVFEDIALIVNAADGCVTVCEVVVVHPFASVTVTVYAPAVRPVNIPVDAPVVLTVGPAIT